MSRDDFIDGILKNRFPSSRLEMNAVADKFDHGDGMIDWREFIAALRPDWMDRGPLTDMERIDDEINRQVALCTCRQKFKVFQVGEGKYRVSPTTFYVKLAAVCLQFSFFSSEIPKNSGWFVSCVPLSWSVLVAVGAPWTNS